MFIQGPCIFYLFMTCITGYFIKRIFTYFTAIYIRTGGLRPPAASNSTELTFSPLLIVVRGSYCYCYRGKQSQLSLEFDNNSTNIASKTEIHWILLSWLQYVYYSTLWDSDCKHMSNIYFILDLSIDYNLVSMIRTKYSVNVGGHWLKKCACMRAHPHVHYGVVKVEKKGDPTP